MKIIREIRNFFAAFRRAGSQSQPTTSRSSGGVDIEVEKNRPC